MREYGVGTVERYFHRRRLNPGRKLGRRSCDVNRNVRCAGSLVAFGAFAVRVRVA